MAARHVFISYSHQDKPFVEHLEQRLQQEDIHTWRDEKAALAGRLERQINDAIFQKDALLLVFSQHSCGSDWVEWETARAREVEKQEDRDVLCPTALDDAWRTATWRGPLQFQIQDYKTLDFSDPGRFDEMVYRLIAGLRSYYGRSPEESEYGQPRASEDTEAGSGGVESVAVKASTDEAHERMKISSQFDLQGDTRD